MRLLIETTDYDLRERIDFLHNGDGRGEGEGYRYSDNDGDGEGDGFGATGDGGSLFSDVLPYKK